MRVMGGASPGRGGRASPICRVDSPGANCGQTSSGSPPCAAFANSRAAIMDIRSEEILHIMKFLEEPKWPNAEEHFASCKGRVSCAEVLRHLLVGNNDSTNLFAAVRCLLCARRF